MNNNFRKRSHKAAVSFLLLISMMVSSLPYAPLMVSAAEEESVSEAVASPGEAVGKNLLNGDFETGDWTGWSTLDGTAMDQNLVGEISNESSYWGSRDFLKEGEYFLSGAVKESEAGAIRSSSFILAGDGYIAFLIGGANPASESCVKLYREGKNDEEDELLRTYYNQNFKDPETGNTLLRIYDKLSDEIGNTLYFVVENGSKDGFSFINVDDFRISMTKEEAVELKKEDIARVKDSNDDYKAAIMELFKNVSTYSADGKGGDPIVADDATGELILTKKLDGSLERTAGFSLDLVELITASTEVVDENGAPDAFNVTINGITYNGDTVTAEDGTLTLEVGTYEVSYTVSYGKSASVEGGFSVTVSAPVEVTEQIINGDFENGLTGWTLLDGTAATESNNDVGVVSDEQTYWNPNQYYCQNGEYFLSGAGKEAKAGRIRSSAFKLGGDGYISFLIGGAKPASGSCIELYDENDQLVKTYTNDLWSDPKTGNTLLRMYDKLDEYKGKTLYFVIVNGSEPGFSFINADDFRTSLTEEQVKTLQDAEIERIKGIPDANKDYIISCYRANGIINEIIVEKELEGSISKYEGTKVNLAELIASSTRVVKSYTLERVDVAVEINSVKFNDTPVTGTDFSQLELQAGTYAVEYTRKYNGVSEDRTIDIQVKAVDKSVMEVENGGFENGDLTGWEVINEDVWTKTQEGAYKGVISADTYWGEKLPYNQEGSYHLDGWEVAGDESATWGVRSSVFTLAGSGFISVRMGGNAAQVRVYKLDGTQVGTYNQSRFNDGEFPFVGDDGSWADMGTCFIDLHEYVGEPLYIELRDRSITGGWAAAFFDDVKCYYESEPDIEHGFDAVVAPVSRDEEEELQYGNVNLPWTLLQRTPDKAVSLSFEDEEGFIVANSEGNKGQSELASVFKEPEYQDEPVLPYRPAGVSGKALGFDGYSNYLSYDEVVEGSKLTVDAYVCPRVFIWSSPDSKREDHIAQVIVGSYSVNDKKGFMLGVTKHGYLAFRIGTGSNWYTLASEDGKCIPTYEWSRVTAVFDGDAGIMELYLNGEIAGSMKVEQGSEIASAGAVLVGKGSVSEIVADNIFDGTMFSGLMDEVQVSLTAMTAEEVKAGGCELPQIEYGDAMLQDSALTGDWFRPTYHAVPAGNWMNEPHALFQYNGKWHLFYQINPAGPYWHNISWGHWVSDDMVNWKFVKEAVIPTEGTISPDGVWTGNVIFTADGEPLLLITAGDDSRPVNGSNQHVGLVRADNYEDPNLTDWTIIGYAVAQTEEMGTKGEFRDAQAFGIGNERYMVVGGADNGKGVAHVFKTTAKTLAQWEAACGNGEFNGMNWEYKGDLFGDYYDSHEYKKDYGTVWEMPNIVPLRDEQGNETGKYLFVFSPQNGDNDVWYYIGNFDTDTCRFTPDEDFGDAKLMDYGDNIFTGPTVYLNPADQKVYICSIMQDGTDHEGKREIAEHQTAGWAFYAGLPRELYLQSDGKSLGIKNIDTSSIEGDTLVEFKNLSASEANEQLKNVNSDCIKIEFEFTGDASKVGFKLKKSADGASELFLTDLLLGLDTKSGSYQKGNTVKGVVYVDKCSIEAYIDNRITVSGSKYIKGTGLEVIIEGDATCSVTVKAMNSIHGTNNVVCGHLNTKTVGVKAATCTEAGYTGDIVCNRCGKKIESGSAIKALGHNYDAGKVTKQPTTMQEGVKTYTCTRCGVSYTEAIAKIEDTTETVLEPKKVGADITDQKANAKAKVTNSGKVVNGQVTGAEAEYTGPVANAAVITIPDTITIDGITYKVVSIAANAFKNNSKVTNLTIGANVTVIGNRAFYKCTSLTKVTIPSKVKTIGTEAFSGCKKLKTVKMGKGVITIGASAFANCSKLTSLSIGTNVVTIGDKAFYKCTALTKVTIPSKVKKIGKQAFSGCKSLKTVKGCKGVTTIGVSAFANCSKLTSLTIGAKTTTIGNKAFYKCTSLTKVTIPSKVKTIGKEAFSGCKKLKTITIKSTKLNSIGKNAWKGIYKKAAFKASKKYYSKYKKLLTSKTGYKKTMSLKKVK